MGPGFNGIEYAHHFLGEPDVFVGIHRLDAALAAGRNKGQILGG